MLKKISINILFLIGVMITFSITMCKSWSVEEKHSYGDECKHCHGDQLQGNQNVKSNCGDCHDPLKMKPEEMKNQERIDAVFNGAHPHKTDNMFKSTPSCFNCHRRTDF